MAAAAGGEYMLAQRTLRSDVRHCSEIRILLKTLPLPERMWPEDTCSAGRGSDSETTVTIQHLSMGQSQVPEWPPETVRAHGPPGNPLRRFPDVAMGRAELSSRVGRDPENLARETPAERQI